MLLKSFSVLEFIGEFTLVKMVKVSEKLHLNEFSISVLFECTVISSIFFIFLFLIYKYKIHSEDGVNYFAWL